MSLIYLLYLWRKTSGLLGGCTRHAWDEGIAAHPMGELGAEVTITFSSPPLYWVRRLDLPDAA